MSRCRGKMWACLCALLLLASLAHAQSDDACGPRGPLLLPEGVEEIVDAGRDALWQLRLDEAEARFERLRRTHLDAAPAATYHLTVAALLRALITQSEEDFERFHTAADAMEEALDEAPDVSARTYLAAERDLARALAYVQEGRSIRAALAGRSAYSGFEAAHEALPSCGDVYKGLGIIHVGIGSVPSTYRRALSVLGFHGTVDQGVEELQRASATAAYADAEARLFLALLNALLGFDQDQAIATTQALAEEHSGSPLLLYLNGFMLLQDHQAEAALEPLREAARLQSQPEVQNVPFVDYYLGDALFKLNRYDEAERHFRRFLQEASGAALRPVAQLDLARAVELQGRRQEAVRLYEQVESDRTYDSDLAAVRAAQELAQRPMTAAERQMLRGRNAYNAGRYERAIELLAPLYAEDQPAPVRVEAAYHLGRTYHAAEELPTALRHYAFAAARHDATPEAKWAPYATFYTAEIVREQGRPGDARRFYERALAFPTPYDFHQGLEQRIKARLSELGDAP